MIKYKNKSVRISELKERIRKVNLYKENYVVEE